ncbi:MAG: sugar ABC transporter permease [Sphaerochaetaceae bacterium]|jgi:alpha-glucoside transport system permease protein|nr:sugar ABC transporter permease [Sphaerochaetaceae bacterium]MDD3366873.1 sugar ABC transporter permease [Sphaerochaetaceae bacterium]MDD4220101.1 sugar ABC transporter permease [Sphaerochaetaceae bacterium]MDY0371639.1 sugar ABC transporter permease [Sphaerochaetaceae bacterium]
MEKGKQLEKRGILTEIFVTIGRIAVSIFVPVVAFFILWAGFIFLRDSNANQGIIALVAIIWGVGGVALLFWVADWVVNRTPVHVAKKLQPFVFVGPALVILTWYLFLPTMRSLYLSFFDAQSKNFIGLTNYIFAFTDSKMLESFTNNLMWIILGTGGSVGFGLIIALLSDRSKFEKVFKSIIFMPMAISFVGAGVIWRFIYAYKPAGEDQIGILNAIVTFFGGNPQAWFTIRPWNNVFLIIILIWLQTGYAMVIISAALKGVPSTIIDAGRIDGASEMRVIRSIIIPYIFSTLVTVSTTIVIISLKIFDIVFTMTNGNYGTEVIASMQYKQMFRFYHYGRGSAIAIVLVIAVIPVMWYNLRQFSKREGF